MSISQILFYADASLEGLQENVALAEAKIPDLSLFRFELTWIAILFFR